MIDTKNSQILNLLTEGKTSKEIIAMGHKPGTVYSVQRKRRQGKERGTTETENHNRLSNRSPESVNVSEIESDPKIIQLKKEIRIAELEKQLGKLKVPTEIESLFISAQYIGEIKLDQCEYQDKGLCTFWAWQNMEEIPKGIGESVSTGKSEWKIKPSAFYCAMCVINTIEVLIDRLNRIRLDTK